MTITATFDSTNHSRRFVLRRLAQVGARAVRSGVNAWLVRKAIRELDSLDDRMLADLGLSRWQIESAVRQQMTPDWS